MTVIAAGSQGRHGSPGPDGATVVRKGNAKVRANADIATRTGVDPERVLIAQDSTVIELVDGQATITGTVPDRLVLRRRHQRWWGHLSADAALSEVTPSRHARPAAGSPTSAGRLPPTTCEITCGACATPAPLIEPTARQSCGPP